MDITILPSIENTGLLRRRGSTEREREDSMAKEIKDDEPSEEPSMSYEPSQSLRADRSSELPTINVALHAEQQSVPARIIKGNEPKFLNTGPLAGSDAKAVSKSNKGDGKTANLNLESHYSSRKGFYFRDHVVQNMKHLGLMAEADIIVCCLLLLDIEWKKLNEPLVFEAIKEYLAGVAVSWSNRFSAVVKLLTVMYQSYMIKNPEDISCVTKFDKVDFEQCLDNAIHMHLSDQGLISTSSHETQSIIAEDKVPKKCSQSSSASAPIRQASSDKLLPTNSEPAGQRELKLQSGQEGLVPPPNNAVYTDLIQSNMNALKEHNSGGNGIAFGDLRVNPPMAGSYSSRPKVIVANQYAGGPAVSLQSPSNMVGYHDNSEPPRDWIDIGPCLADYRTPSEGLNTKLDSSKAQLVDDRAYGGFEDDRPISVWRMRVRETATQRRYTLYQYYDYVLVNLNSHLRNEWVSRCFAKQWSSNPTIE